MEDIIPMIRLFYMAYKKDSVAVIKISNQLTLLLKREMLLNGPKLLKWNHLEKKSRESETEVREIQYSSRHSLLAMKKQIAMLFWRTQSPL